MDSRGVLWEGGGGLPAVENNVELSGPEGNRRRDIWGWRSRRVGREKQSAETVKVSTTGDKKTSETRPEGDQTISQGTRKSNHHASNRD